MSRQLSISAKIAFFLALGVSAQAFAGQVYSRDEAIKVALENSPDVKTAEEDLIQANSKVEGYYGNAYPSIDLSATVTRIFGLDDVKLGKDIQNAMTGVQEAYGLEDGPSAYDNVAAAAIDNVIYGMKSQAYRWQSSVGLTATQVLYAGGKVGTAIEIGKIYKRVQEVTLENTKATVRYNVETAFNQLIYLDSAVAIQQASIDLTQENLDFVIQARESGLSTELDQIRVQLQLDGMKSDLEKVKKQVVLAKNALLNTMGLNWESDINFQGELVDPTSNPPYPDTSMSNVKKRRRELVMLEASEDMLKKNITIEEGGYKPTLALVGGLKYSNYNNAFFDKWTTPTWDHLNKYVALSFSMNLFNGMQTKEGVTQAKSSLRSTQIQKETAERGFRVQIESCANTLEDAQNQLEIQKRQVDLAQRNYDLTNESFKVGSETQLNLLSASLSLRAAKLSYMEAILNWNNAYLALKQATGEY